MTDSVERSAGQKLSTYTHVSLKTTYKHASPTPRSSYILSITHSFGGVIDIPRVNAA